MDRFFSSYPHSASFALISALWLAIAWGCDSQPPKCACAYDEPAEPVEFERAPKHGTMNIDILPKLPADAVWVNGSSRISATPSTPEELGAAAHVFHNWLHKYPLPLVAAEVERIYFVHDIRIGDRPTACTYFKENLVVAIDHPEHIESALHTAFAGLLLRRHAECLDFQAWGAACEPTDAAIRLRSEFEHAVTAQPPDNPVRLYEAGYLDPSTIAHPENDFCRVFMSIFIYNERLQDLGSKYPRIERKTELCADFMRCLDPSFNWPIAAKAK